LDYKLGSGESTAHHDTRGLMARGLGFSAVGWSVIAIVALGIAAWLTIVSDDLFDATEFFSARTFERGLEFIKKLFGFDTNATPAFLKGSEWLEKARLAGETLAMSVAAAGFAALVALATFMFGARNVMMGSLAPYGSFLWKGVFFLTRGLFTVSRAVPELVWALILVFVFTQGILPGVIALAIHNAGVLGKLGSEVVEGLDTRPMRALRSTGASRLQILLFGVLPEALPKCVTFLFYRWEVIIRTTIVVGVVAAGGLGAEFRLAMSLFKFTEVALILFWYLVLVLLVDLVSARLRSLAQ